MATPCACPSLSGLIARSSPMCNTSRQRSCKRLRPRHSGSGAILLTGGPAARGQTVPVDVEVTSAAPLTFDDGSPVRAASAIAPFGDGWLVVQDDATHAAWWREDSVTAVRVVDPVDGFE